MKVDFDFFGAEVFGAIVLFAIFGAFDGLSLGLFDGNRVDGSAVGDSLGEVDVCMVGDSVGTREGETLGSSISREVLPNEGTIVGTMGWLLGSIEVVGLLVTFTGIEEDRSVGAFEGPEVVGTVDAFEVEVVGSVGDFEGTEVVGSVGAFDVEVVGFLVGIAVAGAVVGAFVGTPVGNTLAFDFALGSSDGALEDGGILGLPEYVGLHEVGCRLRGDGFDVNDAGTREGALLGGFATVGVVVVVNGAVVMQQEGARLSTFEDGILVGPWDGRTVGG